MITKLVVPACASRDTGHQALDTAYVLICTGRYKELFHGFYETFVKYITDGRLIVFTDDPSYFRMYVGCRFLYTVHGAWPYIVMNKYRPILDNASEFDGFRRIVLLQANMRFIGKPDFGSEPVTLCLHPLIGNARNYVCGGLVCGDREPFLELAGFVQDFCDKHPMAEWHDETGLNAWYAGHKDCGLLPEGTICVEGRPGNRASACIEVIDKDRFFGCAKGAYAGATVKPSTGPSSLVGRIRSMNRDREPIRLRGRLGNQLWQISAGLCLHGAGLRVSPPVGVEEARIYRECLTGLSESSVRAPFRSYFQHRKWLAHPDDILRFLRKPDSIPEYGAILHYRIGDYKNYSWTRDRFMSHDDVNGYLDLLGLRPRDVTVFTDSPEEVGQFLPDGDWNIAPPMDTLTTFWAMMKCGRLICSASTFSYWAAYLKQGRPGDFVIHPVWTDSVKGDDPDMFKSFHDLVFWDGDFSCHPRVFV